MHSGGIIAEESNVGMLEAGANDLHHKPQHEETRHFEIRICDAPVRVVFADNVISDVDWPLVSKYCRGHSAMFADNASADSMAGGIRYANVIWPPLYQRSAFCRRVDSVA